MLTCLTNIKPGAAAPVNPHRITRVSIETRVTFCVTFGCWISFMELTVSMRDSVLYCDFTDFICFGHFAFCILVVPTLALNSLTITGSTENSQDKACK